MPGLTLWIHAKIPEPTCPQTTFRSSSEGGQGRQKSRGTISTVPDSTLLMLESCCRLRSVNATQFICFTPSCAQAIAQHHPSSLTTVICKSHNRYKAHKKPTALSPYCLEVGHTTCVGESPTATLPYRVITGSPRWRSGPGHISGSTSRSASSGWRQAS